MRDIPRMLVDDPLIRRCPARFLKLEVGPPRVGALMEPDVKFDGEAFWVREALVAILRNVFDCCSPLFNVFWPLSG